MNSPLKWNDLLIFGEIARAGRTSAAADNLRLSPATVSRRTSNLEQGLQVGLLDRDSSGLHLTPTGEKLRLIVDEIQTELHHLIEVTRGWREATQKRTVTLAAPVGFAAWLVAESLPRFYEQHPGIALELVTSAEPVSLARREADIAITTERPERGRLVYKKLQGYRLNLYGSRGYFEQNAPPESLREFRGYDLVWFLRTSMRLRDMKRLLDLAEGNQIVFSSPSTIEQHAAMANDLGIGLLPNYMADKDIRLRKVLPEVYVTRTYWIIFHEANRDRPEVRAVAQFLQELVEQIPD